MSQIKVKREFAGSYIVGTASKQYRIESGEVAMLDIKSEWQISNAADGSYCDIAPSLKVAKQWITRWSEQEASNAGSAK